MIRFLIKGLWRDSGRSRLPIIAVAIGVMLTVFMHSYITGFMGDTIELNARFRYGHLKVMTKAYDENISQLPNDLALTDVNKLLEDLNKQFPNISWSPRIQFSGLVDVPDQRGETRSQGPAIGLGIDLLSGNTDEAERLNIKRSLSRGNLIIKPGEAILSEEFSRKLNINPGEEFTLISSTMFGSITMFNFKLVGTTIFGTETFDRGAIIADINDIRYALDMYDSAGEISGFFKGGFYNDEKAIKAALKFNASQTNDNNEFSPIMKSLSQQGSMGQYVTFGKVWGTYISLIFILAMALVLWNAGLLGGLRRYGEFGLRLAMGEEKSHVYRTLVYEAVIIGISGTIIGTAFGLIFAWLMQKYGIDISNILGNSAMMFPPKLKAKITPIDFYIGFFPGILATVFGAMLAGIGIYKRKTSQLFKELEV